MILATPTSFVALLKAVAYGWQQVTLAQNAAEIRSLAVQLYERLTTFAGHLAVLGKSLGDSVKAFNSSVGSLERMVLPSARRFTELGVQPRQRLTPSKGVEETPRESAATDVAEPQESPRAADGPQLTVIQRRCAERLAQLSTGAERSRGPRHHGHRRHGGIGRAVATRPRAARRNRAAARPQRNGARGAVSRAQAARSRACGRAARFRARTRAPVSGADRADRGALRPARRPAAQRGHLGRLEPDRALRHRLVAAGAARQLDGAVHSDPLPAAAVARLRRRLDSVHDEQRRPQGRAFWGAYAVAKSGSKDWPRCSRTSSTGQRFASTSINPGATRTKMRARAYPAENAAALAAPESLTAYYLYLLGPAGKGVKGQLIECQRASAPSRAG